MPADGSDEAQDAHSSDLDRHTLTEPEAPAAYSDDFDEIPRPTKPFRGWGAAQQRSGTSSPWQRFRTWLNGLFSPRAKRRDSDSHAPGWGDFGSSHTEPVPTLTPPRTSFDDFDAPWSDPFPVQERRASRQSAERPSIEMFEATWDGSYGQDSLSGEQPAIRGRKTEDQESDVEEEGLDGGHADEVRDEVLDVDPRASELGGDFESRRLEPEPQVDVDPLWDAPAVSGSFAPTPQPFVAGEIEEVWTPRTEESEAAPEIVAEEPKPGFFARLFGRKKPKIEPTIAEQERAASVDWATDIAEASAESQLEPADADFADDLKASTAPSDADFGEAEDPAIGRSVDETMSGLGDTTLADDVEVEVEVDTDDVDASATGASPHVEDSIVAEEPGLAEPEPVAPEVVPTPFEKRPSFIGRLFGKKRDSKPAPSLDHSASDSAQLAALLGPIVPIDETKTEVIVAASAEMVEEPVSEVLEETVQELVSETVEEAAPETVDEVVSETVEVIIVEEEAREEEQIPRFARDDNEARDDRDSEELTIAAVEPPPAPAPMPPAPAPAEKKPGFFSSLLRRVSRSQFIPKAALEPELPVPEPTERTESEAIEPAGDRTIEGSEAEAIAEQELMPVAESTPVVDEAIDTLALELVVEPEPEPAAIESEPESEPEPAALKHEPEPEPEPLIAESPDRAIASQPPIAPPPRPAASEFDSTQPFPAFRDARDDFAEEAAAVDGGRPTEEVVVPEYDENQKTDEFEVVPPVTPDAAATAELSPGFFGRLLGRKAIEEAVSGEGEAAPTPLTVIEPGDGKAPFVIAKFRTFYNEIIRDKHQKSDVISGFATAIVSAAPTDSSDPEFAAQLLSKRLSEMLELQAAEANWTGGDAAKYYPEAQYAMVALADETFATIEWPGRPSWHKYMLEPRMYGTRGADLEFFKRIDKLLKDNPEPTKGARDLARVYLLVIASGFRGKFRVPNVKRPLAEYRRRLYEFSHRADALELYAADRRMFPAAFEHTLASRAVGRFTSRQKWIAAVLILAVLYAGISHFAWVKLSAGLKDVMARIETIDANAGRQP